MPLLRISVGRLFHSRGPATEKLLSPICDCVRGTTQVHTKGPTINIYQIKRNVFLWYYVACISWTAFAGSRVNRSARLSSANTLLSCQMACDDLSGCRGVDYGETNPRGWRCFLAFADQRPTSSASGLTNYRRNRNCSGLYFLFCPSLMSSCRRKDSTRTPWYSLSSLDDFVTYLTSLPSSSLWVFTLTLQVVCTQGDRLSASDRVIAQAITLRDRTNYARLDVCGRLFLLQCILHRMLTLDAQCCHKGTASLYSILCQTGLSRHL